MRSRTNLCAAEAPVVMGDGLLAPKITATVVNERSSAAAIVLLPVSLGEGGGGGFHLRGSAWCSQPHQTGGFLVFWFSGMWLRNQRRCSPAWAAAHHHISCIHHQDPHPSAGTGPVPQAPACRCHRSADGSHPGMNFMPATIVNNYVSRQTSDQ